MRSFFMRYATPSIVGLFMVSLVSGVALFFHVGPSAFHGIHEWLSMVLIAGFVLHVWRNWRPMTAYMKGRPLAISLAVSVLASAIFFIPTGSAGGGRPPVFTLAMEVMSHSATEVAPALGTTPAALIDRLTAAGFTVEGPDQRLAVIARTSGKSNMDLAAALLGDR